jgi:glycosyltransferase involved in cell wall biosynthesis
VRVAFITVGNTRRLTGGYLYHARLFAGLASRGVEVIELVAAAAPVAAQESAADSFGERFSPDAYDVIAIDALARGVCERWLDRWRARRPVVVLVHELPSVAAGDENAREVQREAPLLRADRLIAVSAHGRAILMARGVPPDRVDVVSPGYDRLPVPAWSSERPARRDGPLQVLCVAQWIPRKGIATLVEAWSRLDRSDAVLSLVGETDADQAYGSEVMATSAKARPGSLLMLGTVDDATLAVLYRHADVFALPSRYEGYGMVFAEALAFGLPIVAADVESVRSLVTDEAGLFAPVDDARALAETLARLLDDEPLRSSLARAARNRGAGLPTWDDTASGFLRVLERAIGGRARS